MRIPILTEILSRLNTDSDDDQDTESPASGLSSSSSISSSTAPSTLQSLQPPDNTTDSFIAASRSSADLPAATAGEAGSDRPSGMQLTSTPLSSLDSSYGPTKISASSPNIPTPSIAIPKPDVRATNPPSDNTESSLLMVDQGLPPPICAPAGASTHTMINSQMSAGRDINIMSIAGNPTINQNTTPVLLRLKPLLNPINAAFDSYEAEPRSKCFENTRVQLLHDIKNWVTASGAVGSTHAPIFVLDGVAGIGKSTVAQTVADWASQLGILGASFFFTRNDIERMVAKHFFPTIAFQLARHLNSFGTEIEKVVQQDPEAPRKVVTQQLALLILRPLENISLANPETSGKRFCTPVAAVDVVLIVIDALDECNQEEAVTLLTLLAHSIRLMPHFKLFITARPEWHIRSILEEDANHELFRLHEIEDSIVQNDIRIYLDFTLSEEQFARVFPHRRPPWYLSPRDMEILLGMCGTLFIIAATAAKFLLDNRGSPPEKRLARLLDGVSTEDFSGSKRTDVMDKFYIHIICSAAPDDGEEFEEWVDLYQTVLGAVLVLRSPLPCQVLANLLQMDSTTIEGSLFHLHSLVAPSTPQTIFRVHHKTFPDFITDMSRIQHALRGYKSAAIIPDLAAKFLIYSPHHHHTMARACFRTMDRDLKTNIANIPTEMWFWDRAETSRSMQSVIPDELLYAVSHWAFHLHAASSLSEDLQKDLSHWATTHIPQWLEVMSLISKIEQTYEILQTALHAIKDPSENWMDHKMVSNLLNDTSLLVLQSGYIIKLSPMQVYLSALPFLPQDSTIAKIYQHSKSMNVLCGVPSTWDPALVTMDGHSYGVDVMAYSHDGSRLASGDDDTLQLWDGQTGDHIAVLEGHTERVASLAFSPDGWRLASASWDSTIRVWHARTGYCITTLYGHAASVNVVKFSPDGSKLASGSIDGTVQLWDGQYNKHIRILKGHSEGVNTLSFSPDGTKIASGSCDTTVQVWDSRNGNHLTTLQGHSDFIINVIFSPDGSRLASGSKDAMVQLWNGKTYNLLATLKCQNSPVTTLEFSPDGMQLISHYKNGIVCLWNVSTGNSIATLQEDGERIRTVTFSPDGLILASGSGRGVKLWNGKTGHHLSTMTKASEAVNIIKFSPMGARLASGHNNGTLKLWNIDQDGSSFSFAQHTYVVYAVAFSSDGSRVASGSADKTVQLWDGKIGDHVATLTGHSGAVSNIQFSPDGSRIISGSSDTTMCLWNATTCHCIATLNIGPGLLHYIAFSPDGSRIAFDSAGSTALLCDGITGDYIATLNHSSYITSIAFSPCGAVLATGSNDAKVQLWDGKTGHHIATLEAHADSVDALAFSYDGLKLATGSGDLTAKLWHGKTGQHIATLEGHSGSVNALAFSPNGSKLASGAEDRTVILWDTQTGHQIVVLDSDSISTHILTPLLHKLSLASDYAYKISHLFDVSILDFQILSSFSTSEADSPCHIILLVQRKRPALFTYLYLTFEARASSTNFRVQPTCWLPPNFDVSVFKTTTSGSPVAFGCKNGSLLLIDTSIEFLST